MMLSESLRVSVCRPAGMFVCLQLLLEQSYRPQQTVAIRQISAKTGN